MKRFFLFLAAFTLMLCGCGQREYAQVAATTQPVWEMTVQLCAGTDLSVTRLITESVSCLHDYSLNVRQVRAVEAAEVVVISGAGLEEFMEDLLIGKNTIDCSAEIPLLEGHCHSHEEADHDTHHHDLDSHIWLSPNNAKQMASNICTGLIKAYPQYAPQLEKNLIELLSELDDLQRYADESLANLACRDLITFHDGFAYLADAYNLHILEAVEEESGSEASAAELIHLIHEVKEHNLPAIFTETLGSVSAARIISAETGAKVFALDMAMDTGSYMDAMYHNINTLKEALG